MNRLLCDRRHFKNIATRLQHLINSYQTPKQIPISAFSRVLIGDENLEFANKTAKNLHQLINVDSNQKYGRSRTLQLLAKAVSQLPYTDLKAQSLDRYLDAKSFLRIPLTLGHSRGLENGSYVEHKFPRDLEQFEILRDWREVWNLYNFSTEDSPFLAPPIPIHVFGKVTPTLKFYKNWPLDRKDQYYHQRKTIGYGEAGVIVRIRGRIAGSMKWYWWNNADEVLGSEFTAQIKHFDEILRFGFQFRPYHEHVSWGPLITPGPFEEHSESFLSHIEAIRAIRPLIDDFSVDT